MRLIRLFTILFTLLRYIFNRRVLPKRLRICRGLSYLNPYSYSRKHSRGAALKLCMQKLGPIFVKFGQVLSTRRDLFPSDIADELAQLQDKVPDFSGKAAIQIIESSLGGSIEQLFAEFDEHALASASIAQVHAATLQDGERVVVKVLRPGIKKAIRKDVALLYWLAKLLFMLLPQGPQLRPVEIVAEFESTLYDELDLQREAANAALLKRNFTDSHMMHVPTVYWDYTRQNVMVIERIDGVRISDIQYLRNNGVDMKKLAEYGVEIFFTQVFRDSFFHADMHPGNIFVDITDPANPVYKAVDFGIMGTLTEEDQTYLAENFLAFFRRDYRRVAELHIESGWVPADTRADQFEAAIRTVFEPVFEKPLGEISYAQLLLRLLRTAERFNMSVQPQLFLLQKTLLNIEGLGRQLYPELDLWNTAKPFLENWAKQRFSLINAAKDVIQHWPEHAEKLLQAPSLLSAALRQCTQPRVQIQQTPATNTGGVYLGIGVSCLAISLGNILYKHNLNNFWQYLGLLVGLACCLIALRKRRRNAPDRS